jgi:DNA-binding transcriptional LysR family regulator
MLDVKRLSILREVANRASFSAAADALYLSQSAVSQQVATLEKEVGMKLLDRTNGGPRLTEAGQVLISHADAVICRLEEAERELSSLAGLEGGSLRLISFPSASATVVTRAVSAFTTRHPEVEVRLAEGEPEDGVPALRGGDYDLAIVFDYPTLPLEVGRDVELTPLLTEQMYLAMPADHPHAGSPAVDLADFADTAWLSGTCPSSCADLVKNACRDAGFDPRIAYESDDYSVLQGLVAAGLGVTLMPDLVAVSTLRSDVTLVPISPEAPQRRIWAATRASGSRSPATEAMLATLQQVGREFEAEIAQAEELAA